MKLNNIWGYGQLFGFSGLDGANRYYKDFIGTLTAEKIGVRFELDKWIKVFFNIKGDIQFKAVMSDFIDAKTEQGDFFMTFADSDTLVGYSPVVPQLIGEDELKYKKSWDVDVWMLDGNSMAVICQEKNGLYQFCIKHSFSPDCARSGANYYINANIEELKKAKYDYYLNMPECKNKEYEQLYYKAISVNKVNIHTPEGKIPCMWTTPDRVPHRHMWLWDSVFHALAMVTYNADIAKCSIKAVLSRIRGDGFMPHMMNPMDNSDLTQPPVLAWGVYNVYKKTNDRQFLEESVCVLERYLTWDIENRDKNGNGLLEWLTEPDDLLCKCGESGLDDSPRFDFDYDMDAIDFSSFIASDAEYLSKIFIELGDNIKGKKWQKISDDIKAKINQLMWDEKTSLYYDRLFSGEFSMLVTPASFFPMFAGVPSKERAEKMVKVLKDKTLLWSEAPLSSIAQNHPTFASSMWRGGVWLNLNYLVISGLKKYGFDDVAKELANATLKMVNKWYQKTGVIYEFFDPKNELYPYECDRKGKTSNPPDWRKHVHSISDFNWSACFVLLLIQEIIY